MLHTDSPPVGSLRGHVSLPEGVLVPAEFSEHPADVVTHIPLHVEHARGHAPRGIRGVPA